MGTFQNLNKCVLGCLVWVASAQGAGSYSEQPLRFRCEVSTRVVAGTLLVGIDPVEGYLTYELDKYHAEDATQTYKRQGSSKGNAVTFENQGRRTVITASSHKFSAFQMVFTRCGAPGKNTLESVKIAGVDHGFRGTAPTCERVE